MLRRVGMSNYTASCALCFGQRYISCIMKANTHTYNHKTGDGQDHQLFVILKIKIRSSKMCDFED